jgi:hypothetical protein
MRKELREADSLRKELTVTKTQLAQALKARPDTATALAATDKVIAGLRDDLAAANESARDLRANERTLKSNIATITQERDEPREATKTPPIAYMWGQPLTTRNDVCLSHAAAALKKIGSEIHYSGPGVSGAKGGTLLVVSCNGSESVMAVGLDGTAAEEWRDKLRDTFLAEHQ